MTKHELDKPFGPGVIKMNGTRFNPNAKSKKKKNNQKVNS